MEGPPFSVGNIVPKGDRPTVPFDMHAGCSLSLQLLGLPKRRRPGVELEAAPLHTKPLPSSPHTMSLTCEKPGISQGRAM